MDYLVFIDHTRTMNPQQRSLFFNELNEEEKEELVRQAGDIETMMVHTRMVIGAERIEREPPGPKRDHMQRIYDKLDAEYQGLLKGKKLDEDTVA